VFNAFAAHSQPSDVGVRRPERVTFAGVAPSPDLAARHLAKPGAELVLDRWVATPRRDSEWRNRHRRTDPPSRLSRDDIDDDVATLLREAAERAGG
jgi:hypothetical protein